MRLSILFSESRGHKMCFNYFLKLSILLIPSRSTTIYTYCYCSITTTAFLIEKMGTTIFTDKMFELSCCVNHHESEML